MSNLEELKRWIHNNSAKHAKRRKRRNTLDPWAPFHRLRIENDPKTNLRHCLWAAVVLLVLLYVVIYFLY